jgi:UDP-N-acetylglucosamine--dolichyl-phosphate N-acetylglucosaminephosphotransferase
MWQYLILPILIGFFTTLFFIPFWIKKAKEMGLVGRDIHKKKQNEVAESGGIPVIFGFVLGTLSYVAIITFLFSDSINLTQIFVLLSTVLIASLIAMIDDAFGWKKGLSKKSRLFFLFFAAIPLMVINAGDSTMMGIEFGLFYPLLFIPLGIMGVTATFNFLAGYNGLETSQGIIILSGLAIALFLTEKKGLSLIALVMIFCLLAFYMFNKFPATIFPGDTLTYSVGALIGCLAILGDMEKLAVFFFIPYGIEAVLKIRGKLEKESFARVNKDRRLENRYDKIYRLEHLAVYVLSKMKKKVYEKDIVYLINGFQILIILLGFLLIY